MNGLIFACRLDGEGGARQFDSPQQALAADGAGPCWIHLDYSHPESELWLREQSGLDEMVADALLAEETRPRVVPYRDGTLIALRGVNLTPGSEPEDMVAVRLFVTASLIISTRKRPLQSVSDIVNEWGAGEGPVSVGEFIIALTGRLTERVGLFVDQTEDRLAGMEDAVLENQGGELRGQLGELRRQTVSIRRYLAPQREALNRLCVDPPAWLRPHERSRLQEGTDHMVRLVEDLDAVRDRAAVTQEELVNQISEQLNQRLYVLSIIAAIFLPLGFMTGLLGINVGGIPGADEPTAFWLFNLLLIVVVAGQIWLFRRKHWL